MAADNLSSRLRVTSNDRTHDLVNGEMARVIDIAPEGQALTLCFDVRFTVLLDGRRTLALER